MFSQNCGNPTACYLTNTSCFLYNFLFGGYYYYTPHVTTYNGGTLNYYYDPGTARKNPTFNDDPGHFLSINPATGSNTCTESSYCQFFQTAAFNEDEYTAMTGVVNPIMPNDGIEMAKEDWERGIGGPIIPNPGSNGQNSTAINSNIALDSATAHYYAGLNGFTYSVKNPYGSGELVVSDMMGRIIKSSIICGQTGAVPIQLPENNSYVYYIIIDGQRVKSGIFFVPAQ